MKKEMKKEINELVAKINQIEDYLSSLSSTMQCQTMKLNLKSYKKQVNKLAGLTVYSI